MISVGDGGAGAARRGRLVILAAKQDGAVLLVGSPHARAELDEVFVGVDDGAFDDLRGLRVVPALVERDPSTAEELPGFLERETNLWTRREASTAHEISDVPTPVTLKRSRKLTRKILFRCSAHPR